MPGRQAKVLFTFVLILYLPIAMVARAPQEGESTVSAPVEEQEEGNLLEAAGPDKRTTQEKDEEPDENAGTTLDPSQVVVLAVAALVAVLGVWITLWVVAVQKPELVKALLLNQHFLRGMAVIMVLAAVTVLALAGRLDGEVAGAILSGIVGYVLGSRVSPEATQSAKRDSHGTGPSPASGGTHAAS